MYKNDAVDVTSFYITYVFPSFATIPCLPIPLLDAVYGPAAVNHTF
jgi:hypothetical protein